MALKPVKMTGILDEIEKVRKALDDQANQVETPIERFQLKQALVELRLLQITVRHFCGAEFIPKKGPRPTSGTPRATRKQARR